MHTIMLDMGETAWEDELRKLYDSSCRDWNQNPEYNHMFLKANQNYCNDLVFARGHLFLNEVYDMLGLPRTRWGALIGWTKETPVDFGIGKTLDDGGIPLVFNPTGIILDKL